VFYFIIANVLLFFPRALANSPYPEIEILPAETEVYNISNRHIQELRKAINTKPFTQIESVINLILEIVTGSTFLEKKVNSYNAATAFGDYYQSFSMDDRYHVSEILLEKLIHSFIFSDESTQILEEQLEKLTQKLGKTKATWISKTSDSFKLNLFSFILKIKNYLKSTDIKISIDTLVRFIIEAEMVFDINFHKYKINSQEYNEYLNLNSQDKKLVTLFLLENRLSDQSLILRDKIETMTLNELLAFLKSGIGKPYRYHKISSVLKDPTGWEYQIKKYTEQYYGKDENNILFLLLCYSQKLQKDAQPAVSLITKEYSSEWIRRNMDIFLGLHQTFSLDKFIDETVKFLPLNHPQPIAQITLQDTVLFLESLDGLQSKYSGPSNLYNPEHVFHKIIDFATQTNVTATSNQESYQLITNFINSFPKETQSNLRYFLLLSLEHSPVFQISKELSDYLLDRVHKTHDDYFLVYQCIYQKYQLQNGVKVDSLKTYKRDFNNLSLFKVTKEHIIKLIELMIVPSEYRDPRKVVSYLFKLMTETDLCLPEKESLYLKVLNLFYSYSNYSYYSYLDKDEKNLITQSLFENFIKFFNYSGSSYQYLKRELEESRLSVDKILELVKNDINRYPNHTLLSENYPPITSEPPKPLYDFKLTKAYSDDLITISSFIDSLDTTTESIQKVADIIAHLFFKTDMLFTPLDLTTKVVPNLNLYEFFLESSLKKYIKKVTFTVFSPIFIQSVQKILMLPDLCFVTKFFESPYGIAGLTSDFMETYADKIKVEGMMPNLVH
jgi:hypothetical protein